MNVIIFYYRKSLNEELFLESVLNFNIVFRFELKAISG